MTTILMLHAGNPQYQIHTPQGLKRGYEPFWASHWWLADHAHLRGALLSVQEYRSRVLASTPDALNVRCYDRGMTPCATRTETLAMLLEGMSEQDVGAPEPYTTMTYFELVTECGLRGLPHSNRDEMIATLAAADAGDGLDSGAELPAPIEELGAEVTNEIAPDPIPLASVALPEVDRKVLADLKVALDANDYNTVWSLATNLTETRPASKAKPEMFSWARGVVASLEG
jgi:hypothetical protein